MELLDGWKWRTEREWERAAWMVAYLLQPWSKRPLKPADLLRPPETRTLEEKMQLAMEKQARRRDPHGGN